MDIAHTTFSSSEFNYNRNEKLFSEYISTLSQGSKRRVFSQAYDDACDEGFRMVSTKTGDEVVFVIDSIDTNGEDEIAGWRLVPTRDSIRRVPSCKGLRVLIIND